MLIQFEVSMVVIMKSSVFWDINLFLVHWKSTDESEEYISSIFYLEGGSYMYLWNVIWLSLDCMVGQWSQC
jgi:hypothetical protein